MTPETYKALMTYLHPMAPHTEEEREAMEAEDRAAGLRESSIIMGRMLADVSGWQFKAGTEVVRIIYGDEVAERLRKEATDLQRHLEATD